MVFSKSDIKDLVGLSLDEFTTKAKERGVGRVRPTEIDGKPQMVTKDMRRDRINVAVETKDGTQVVTALKNIG
eukprot:CAMPEP_0206184308 /NCGR_PEP_ID=MMETSP0166-20121206/1148_1 /ASSEMBLY_ACC=CAM_ASM_000260 /TAXON_ID=95228 /ORGANISM="Vannella robusta, Strain DIVA3 518/3/11/1/6" /LENGTH=72 /DNA_ID=CAMNT_0053599313 /DNA_START=1 /DNA_END=219 /DNA_ORIENTATION=-